MDTITGDADAEFNKEKEHSWFRMYDWSFLLDQEKGFTIVKSAIDLINRSQNIDLYELWDNKEPDGIKLGNDIADVIKSIGQILQSMASGDEVAHVGDLIGMYAHIVEMVTDNCGRQYAKDWANDMSLRIGKLEKLEQQN